MIDEKAIKLIQDTAVRAAGIATVVTGLDARPTLAVPNGISLVDAEPFQEHRYRFRGTMSTASISDFNQYVGARGAETTDKPLVFINADCMQACAFFNLWDNGNPGHGDDCSVLSLDQVASYTALNHINGVRLTQKECAEFFEDWAENVEFFDGDYNRLPLGPSINALRNTTIATAKELTSSVSDLKAVKTGMEQVEAKGKDTLPTRAKFFTEGYNGLAGRHLDLRIAPILAGETVIYTVRIVRQEELVQAMAQEFKSILFRDLAAQPGRRHRRHDLRYRTTRSHPELDRKALRCAAAGHGDQGLRDGRAVGRPRHPGRGQHRAPRGWERVTRKRKPPCRDRILAALRLVERTPLQLANELFVDRRTVRRYLNALHTEGLVFRKFYHDEATGKPDHLYSSVRYPPRDSTQAAPADVEAIVGDWDTVDMRRVRE